MVRWRPRLAERLGRVLGFSTEGRDVRVWVQSRPGEEDAVVVEATVVEAARGEAVLDLRDPVQADGRELRRVVVVPREPGWGLDALWATFIAVDAYPAHAPEGAPIASWWIRLAGRR